jgi:hypothetical protein
LFGEADPGALGRGERLLGDVLRWQPEMLGVAGCSEAELEVLALDVPQRVRVAVRLVRPMNIGDSMISWSPLAAAGNAYLRSCPRIRRSRVVLPIPSGERAARQRRANSGRACRVAATAASFDLCAVGKRVVGYRILPGNSRGL